MILFFLKKKKKRVKRTTFSAAGATHRKNSQERTLFSLGRFEKVEKEQEKNLKNHQILCSLSTQKKESKNSIIPKQKRPFTNCHLVNFISKTKFSNWTSACISRVKMWCLKNN